MPHNLYDFFFTIQEHLGLIKTQLSFIYHVRGYFRVKRFLWTYGPPYFHRAAYFPHFRETETLKMVDRSIDHEAPEYLSGLFQTLS